VPYAAPPVGPNRWRAPQPALSWSGVRAADHFGPSCIQGIGDAGFGPWTPEYVVHGKVSEDCLTLNIWTPAKAANEKLPVLVWIHGGGFSSGSASVPIYEGAALAAKGVVFVGINYRLGVLGFLAHPELTAESPNHASGNYGLMDQIAALKWVRDNIAAFGGDPNAITISGQSAGAAAVVDLDVSPLSKGLYARAIAQSGAGLDLPVRTLGEAEQRGVEFAKSKGASSIAALRAMPADAFVMQGPEMLAFSPIADGFVLPDTPKKLLAEGRFNDTPFLTGLVADEASAFGPFYASTLAPADCDAFFSRTFGTSAAAFRDAYATKGDCGEAVKQVLRDRGVAGTVFWASARQMTSRQPVFVYLYNHTEPGPNAARYASFHSSEIPYVFGTLDKSPERGFTAADRAIADTMSAYWLNFLKTGNPNGTGLAQWPAFDASTMQIMDLGDTFRARTILDPAKLKLIKTYVDSGGRAGIL
jgi:para-nitrobenzyl esterase